jgi:hypothetical protein
MAHKLRYATTPGFDKDFKKLTRRYRTLEGDLDTLKARSIEAYHIHGVDSGGILEMPGFCTDAYRVLKVKKFASRSFKSKGVASGLRLVYGYDVATQDITLIELYYKGDRELEDRERIRGFLGDRLSS